MKKLIWTSKFLKASEKFLHSQSELTDIFKQKIRLIEENPFHPSLRTHKLKGKLRGFLTCSINYYFRIVFEIEKDSKTGNEVIILHNIGSHNQVY